MEQMAELTRWFPSMPSPWHDPIRLTEPGSGIEQLDQAEFHGPQHDEVTLFQGLAVLGQGDIVHGYETTTWDGQLQVVPTELKHGMSTVDRSIANHNVARLIAAQQDAVLHRQLEFLVVPDQRPPVGLTDSAGALRLWNTNSVLPKRMAEPSARWTRSATALSINGYGANREAVGGDKVPCVPCKFKVPDMVSNVRLLVQVDVVVAGSPHRDGVLARMYCLPS